MANPGKHDHMFLTCYADTYGYGWHHVDLFVHDKNGLEVNWVHWQVDKDGPEAADAVTAKVEPQLRRLSEWKHGISANCSEYWTADAAWT
jgi:hypothetical protein